MAEGTVVTLEHSRKEIPVPAGSKLFENKIPTQFRKVEKDDGTFSWLFSPYGLEYNEMTSKMWVIKENYSTFGTVLFDSKFCDFVGTSLWNAQVCGSKTLGLDAIVLTPTNSLQADLLRKKAACALCHRQVDLSSKCRCSNCHQVYYCNVTCQRAHWVQAHKAECKIHKTFFTKKEEPLPLPLDCNPNAVTNELVESWYERKNMAIKALAEMDAEEAAAAAAPQPQAMEE